MTHAHVGDVAPGAKGRRSQRRVGNADEGLSDDATWDRSLTAGRARDGACSASAEWVQDGGSFRLGGGGGGATIIHFHRGILRRYTSRLEEGRRRLELVRDWSLRQCGANYWVLHDQASVTPKLSCAWWVGCGQESE